MRIVIISLAVKRANTDAPSAVLIPAECLHISALNRTDRRADAAEHVMPKMPPPIPVGARRAEIIVFRYGIALCNRRCGADAVLFFPHNFLSVFKCHRAIFAEHTRKHRIIGAAIIKVKLCAMSESGQRFVSAFSARERSAPGRYAAKLPPCIAA